MNIFRCFWRNRCLDSGSGLAIYMHRAVNVALGWLVYGFVVNDVRAALTVPLSSGAAALPQEFLI
jgi:hypothetical protein